VAKRGGDGGGAGSTANHRVAQLKAAAADDDDDDDDDDAGFRADRVTLLPLRGEERGGGRGRRARAGCINRADAEYSAAAVFGGSRCSHSGRSRRSRSAPTRIRARTRECT